MFQECIGRLKEGLIIKPKRGQNKLIAHVYKSYVLPGKELGCLRFKVTNNTELMPSTSLLERAPMIHDCKAGHCRVVEQYKSVRVEQEDVLRKTYHLKHNSQHDIYILNKYSL